MGLDFIRGKKGKPWRKGWDGQQSAVAVPGLFDLKVEHEVLMVTMDCGKGVELQEGMELVVELAASELIGRQGPGEVGRVRTPPSGIVDLFKRNAGVALGIVRHVSAIGNSVQVELR